MPETLATWEKQRHNFAFDEEKEKYVSEKSKEVVESKKVCISAYFNFFLQFPIITGLHHSSKLNIF